MEDAGTGNELSVRYLALATDYDGTLATDGVVDEATLDALERCTRSGRRLLLVTGRRIDDLEGVFPELDRFDRVIAENGAVLYRPAEKESVTLASPPPTSFIDELRARGVDPIDVGEVIVATWEPHETTVLQTIRDCGLELEVIFNKGAVMILPTGVTKATGLRRALDELRISPHNTVGVGDAENDHALLQLCGCSAAVANALAPVKERADIVLRAARGAGVSELIDALVTDDLAAATASMERHDIALGNARDGSVSVRPSGDVVLVAGPSGAGKSTFVTGLIERIARADFQFCVVDPEGDYGGLENAASIGTHERAPAVDEIVDLLSIPKDDVTINMLAIAPNDRPDFFAHLLPRLHELRTTTGRPHWLVIDEAHHLMPSTGHPSGEMLSTGIGGTVMITVHADWLARAAMEQVTSVVGIGDAAGAFEDVARVLEIATPRIDRAPADGEAAVWRIGEPEAHVIAIIPPHGARIRHKRKYAHGDLGADRSFVFTGPDGKLSLRAQNLVLFAQMAEGVDDDTWVHHLRAGDYARWFREVIKDPELADEAERAGSRRQEDAAASRRAILEAITQRYTAPA